MDDLEQYLTESMSSDKANDPLGLNDYSSKPKRSLWSRVTNGWFRISSPPEPDAAAPLIQREGFRRARTVSVIIFLLQIFVITSLPAGFGGTNSFLAVLLLFAFIANIVAMLFNRKNFVIIAALILVFNVEISISTNILTTPGGLSLAALPLFDILVIPLVLSASVLPAGYVFLFAVVNILYVILGTLYMPHHADLGAALHTSGVGLVTLPIVLQIVLAFLAFFWVQSANQAIQRADKAEQIAQLEHDIAESRQQIAQQKTQLESDIQEISRALLNANSGNGPAKISVQGNVLWLIVGPINNLIARMQRMRHVEVEHQQLITELEQLLYILRSTRESQRSLRLPPGMDKGRLGLLYDEISRIQPGRDSGIINDGSGVFQRRFE